MPNYHPYPEYKDSGIDWLGNIPAHWQVTKLRFLFSLGRGLGITKENLLDEGVPCINYGEIHSKYGFEILPEKHSLKCVASDYLETGAGALLSAGDFVFADTSEDIEGAGNFSHLNSDTPTFAGYHTVIARPISNDIPRYMAYLFDSLPYRYQIRKSVSGIKVFSITHGILKNCYLWIPQKKEQQQIAAFLDRETAKIDQLIAKQQQLIELLKEKRQAVISHAVTKGLNPNVKMKPSGVEWFDVLPEHWKLGKLGYYAKVSNGATPSRENLDYWNDGSVAWLNSSKVNDVYIKEADQFITRLAVLKTGVQKVSKFDLVMAITGEGQTRGRVAICLMDATINQHLASISIKDKTLHYEFLFYWLSIFYERIRYESSGAGSTKGAITCSDIMSFPIVIPSHVEQIEIINQCKIYETKLDNLLNRASQQIGLLRERRAALISAAVTGKIDVREVALLA